MALRTRTFETLTDWMLETQEHARATLEGKEELLATLGMPRR